MIKLNQRGYVIKIVLIVFAILIGLMLFPVRFPLRLVETGCVVGQAGEGSVFLPPIINAGLNRYGFDGGWDESRPNVEYVQIRRNVPIFMNSNDPNYVLGYPDWIARDDQAGDLKIKWPVIADTEYLGVHADTRHTLEYHNANQPGFEVYYPNGTGEVELPYVTTDRTGTAANILTLRTEGLLIFVHLGSDGEPIKMNYGDHIYYLTDFYQDKVLLETPDAQKGYNVLDMFQCIDPDASSGSLVQQPPQERSVNKDQLQLEWFLLGGGPGMYAHCKPAVYLYPERRQLVNVKVFPKGELSYTDPVYDPARGWTVEANPDGRLLSAFSSQISAREYDYLYYESKLLDSEIKKPSVGWVTSKSEMEDLLDEILPRLGLNAKEQKDFMDYWLTKLPESPYYFVGLIEKDQRDYIEALDVTPSPETSIRFSLYFEMLDQSINVTEPIIHTPSRSGFTLVDWGGMIKLHPGTPFTCSQ